MKSKTVLITGAAGFIGSNLVEYLFNKHPNYHFISLDALTYAGHQENIPQHIRESKRHEFWHGDVTNPDIVSELMSRSDMVIHLAAETHVARSIFDNSKFFHTDIIGTQTMMNALLKCPRVERFIHISSSEVYGTAVTKFMDENHPLNPRSPYAGAKAGADRLVYSYFTTYDMPTVIIRPFNNYGPRQHLEKAIPRFITSALKNEPLTIHGDGNASRDWIYVEDHCEALDKVLHTKNFDKIKNQVINVGSGKAVPVIKIAQKILAELQRGKGLLTFIGDRPGQVTLHRASIKKARELLSWKPKTDFTEGLTKTIRWYQTHQEWWKKREWMKQLPIQTTRGIIEMH